MKRIALALQLFLVPFFALSQLNKKVITLGAVSGLKAVHVTLQEEVYLGKKSLRVVDTAQANASEVKYVRIENLPFRNGIIELALAGKPLSTAAETARGFVGVAFRIDDADSQFECIYLRPTNGRAEDQARRNHSTQYISYPDFPWEKLRKDSPGKYESYVDLEAGKWTRIRIEVQDAVAKLFVHDAPQPSLIVSDLKYGAKRKGAIGLWIGPGTEAHFRDLVITSRD
jgi:hypothetical protein